MKSLVDCNADNAGPSREWHPERAPATDEVLHVLLETRGLSIVVVSVVFCVFRKKSLNNAPSA